MNNRSFPNLNRLMVILFLAFNISLFGANSTLTDSFVERLYSNIFNRTADQSGKDYWRGEFDKGKTALEVAKFFYDSNEMKDLNLSDEEFVNRTYKTFFDREPDDEGKSYWLGEMREKGRLREQVFYGFAMSDEFKGVCKDYGVDAYDEKDLLYAFIERFYNYILQRNSDYEGREFWYERLSKGDKTASDIVKNFFFSKEFLDKNVNDDEFITIAYRTILNREPDSEGKKYWIGELKKKSREDILTLFLASDEFDTLSKEFLKDGNKQPSYDYEYKAEYKGLKLYSKNISPNDYKLEQLSEEEFDALSEEDKFMVADKLLSTLYFGMPYLKLKDLIDSKQFITTVKNGIKTNSNDLDEVEAYMENENFFAYPSWGKNEIYKILERFYLLEKLDKNYIDFWSAYVLTQTIMFSPAYELASSHTPNITRVYSRLVRNFRDETTIGYSTFLYMISEDNWRRFRSPEDNGREMLEIFTMDFDDSHVPVSAQALKNWKLDRDYDTLVIGLNENRKPLSLFNTTIYNGFDFYRELVKSDQFLKTAIRRVTDIYFPDFNETKKSEITDKVFSSKPQTWEDVLLQIVFSKEYLLHSERVKSAEETFFFLSKKMNYKHDKYFFGRFVSDLENMGQAAMKYKLGKKSEVPLDTQSFMNYHKFIREEVLMRDVNDNELNNYDWGKNGWIQKEFLSDDKFSGIMFNEYKKFVDSLADYLFMTVVSRKADEEEKTLFEKHMLKDNGEPASNFELNKLEDRVRAAVIILDYLSRLKETYRYRKVEK